MLEALKVIILGIVQGITEWLPISSTGHLILVEELIKLQQNDAFKNMFNVVNPVLDRSCSSGDLFPIS